MEGAATSTTAAAPAAEKKPSVLRTLRAPFASVNNMLQRSSDKQAAKQQRKHVEAQAVEMHDFTASSSFHRKTGSDSTDSSTVSADSQHGM
jgi:hypothetical protein